MSRRNRIIAASIVVGILGAGIAGFLTLGELAFMNISKITNAITLLSVLTGIISGFLSCFVLSIRYLRSMENRIR